MKYIIDIIMLCMLLMHIYRRLWIDIYIDDDDDDDDDVWSSRRILILWYDLHSQPFIWMFYAMMDI